MSNKLEEQFHSEMLKIYHYAIELKPPYYASFFLRMVNEFGGKATADKLLATTKPSQGFTELFLRGKENLCLSVEYLVLKDPWNSLFTTEQLDIARKRLNEVKCPLPSHITDSQGET